MSPASGTPTLATSQHQEGGGWLRLREQGLQGDKRLQCVSRGCKMPPVCVLRQFLGEVTAQATSTGVNAPQGVREQCTHRGPQAPLSMSRSEGLRSPGQDPTSHAHLPSLLWEGPGAGTAALRPLRDHHPLSSSAERTSSGGKWGGDFCRSGLGSSQREATVKAAGLQRVTPVGR